MNRRELLRELSRVQATWVNRNAAGTGDVDITAEEEQDYLTRLAEVFERAREDVRRRKRRSVVAAAPAAVEALVAAFNPKQRRDENGRWTKIGGGGGPSVRAQRIARRGLRPTASDQVKVPEMRPFKDSRFATAGTSVIFDDGWPQNDDPDDRYSGFWQKRFTNQRAIRQVFRNMAAGKTGDELYDGVDMDSFMHMDARTYDPNAPEDDPGTPYFTEDDLKADLHNAAVWLHTQLAQAPVNTNPLYRGMRMRASEVPKPGDEFSTDVASWAEERFWGEHYARLEEDPSLGRVGDIEVVFRLNGPKRSVDLGPGKLDEHLTQGRYRVTRVSGQGRKRFINLEEVAEDE